MIFKKNAVTIRLDLIRTNAKQEGSNLVKELDKLIEAEPTKTGVDYYNGYIFDQYACPVCAKPIGDEAMMFKHCPHCGQKIKRL